MEKNITNWQTLFVVLTAIICLTSIDAGANSDREVQILHSIVACDNDGPKTTITLELTVTNNQTASMSNALMAAAHIPKISVTLLDMPGELYLGNISGDETIEETYRIIVPTTYPLDAVEHMAFFWNLRYYDDSDQECALLVKSHSIAQGGE